MNQKVMLENTQNSTCDFAEELISYLYDEMSGVDKSGFEKHLKTCSPCKNELAGFSLARTSVQEWHNKEFLPLPTPPIEIPYPVKIETISRSWFAKLRALFTLSPTWTTASTAFAALALCFGLFVIWFSSMPNDDEVLVQTEKNVKVTASPTTGNQNQNSNISNPNQNTQKPSNSSESPLSDEGQKPARTSIESTKIVAQPNVTKPNNLPVKTVQPKTTNKTVKPPIKTPKQKAPSFLDDDEEEDSLTLTDLLEGIGAGEIDDKK